MNRLILRVIYERQNLLPATLETGCPTKRYMNWLEELAYTAIDGDWLTNLYDDTKNVDLKNCKKFKRFSGDAYFPNKL